LKATSEAIPPVGSEASFCDLLETCIRSAFKDVLGESATSAIAFYAQPEVACRDPASFHQKLYSLLKGPALTLEKLAITDLYHRLNLQLTEQAKFDFASWVDMAKTMAVAGQPRVEAPGPR
jgi:hypothetical protein